MNCATMIDGYKTSHAKMYPKGTTLVYSNWTPRKSRIEGCDHIVFFGLQYFIKEYLGQWDSKFFTRPKEEVVEEIRKILEPFCDCDIVDRLGNLHDLGYLPLLIKSVPEGTQVPIGVPCFTIQNTHPEFFWLTNFFETILSCTIWQACTSATIASRFKKLLAERAEKTDPANVEFVNFQGHDFSMRGMSSYESACVSGAGHLLSFLGTDTIPATEFLKKYYNGSGLVGCSVPASEHSVMSMGDDINEIETFNRLLDTFPSGILSVVSDTWNLWQVVADFLPKLKDKIKSRDGKLVVRPDSSRTTPQDIICGTNPANRNWSYKDNKWNEAEIVGLVESLWNIFGGSYSKTGYKVLHQSIGIIYGDAISYDRCKEICDRLEAKGFASTNLVYGIGSYTYQFNTRDTFGFAMKATYGEINGVGKNIYKDPITDSGEKTSAKGLIQVFSDSNGKLRYIDECSWEQEQEGLLVPVYQDGNLLQDQSLEEIRERVLNVNNHQYV